MIRFLVVGAAATIFGLAVTHAGAGVTVALTLLFLLAMGLLAAALE